MNTTDVRTEGDAAVPKKEKPTWEKYIGIEKYALVIYRLQHEAGLTFKEARATLRPFQVIPDLAEEWGCSEENIHNMRRIGREKVKKAAGDDVEMTRRLLPLELCHVF
ncbi:MAG: hypothetical protein LBI08_01055 [Methanomassiliicoccaceae archaeon]|jgi:hypothetical protein|nr:hypothetical protein [Methanomassiliicoccaceae archaeon]